MTNRRSPVHEVGFHLPGLDGSNPLGFLAALGVLRTLDGYSRKDAVSMDWQEHSGIWIPRIFGGGNNIDELLNRLVAGFVSSDATPWRLDKRLPFEAERLRHEVSDAVNVSTWSCRDRIDTLASFGAECSRDDKGNFKDTSLRMVRSGDSAGNGLLAYGRRIQEETTSDNLRSTLVERWTYEDEGCALRWDPAEHHGYALQWTNPSNETTVSVRGANRLALAAMPLLPTIPGQARLATVAFGRPNKRQESLTWPIWTAPLGLRVTHSLLSLATLQEDVPDPRELLARGIEAIFRCDRIMTSTYYRNFTPAQRIV